MNRLVVISNRVPVPSAGAQVGGLAVALEGVMESNGGLWFGWSGQISEGAAVQHVETTRTGKVEYATVDLTQQEHDGYYNHFANGVLWPLLHTLPELVQFDRVDARVYRDVNTRLARTLKGLLQPSDIVWVHDYHMLPMPAALREAGVRNPIGFFLHIPFASTDVLGNVPDMPAFVRDMLGADLIGFQTDRDLANFAAAAEELASASRTHGNMLHVAGPGGGRRVRLGVFPVEIETGDFARIALEAERGDAVRSMRESLNGQKLLIGAERLDPTKGLLQRVAGLRAFFETWPEWRGKATMVQIAASSRKEVTSYRNLRASLDSEAGALNADLATPDWTPLRLVSRGVERAVVAGYLRMARACLVTPLRDGMNLVAKEFVAAQNPDDPGVLVLSKFAGAAQQLETALMVNPHDAQGMADAIRAALVMPLGERQERWHAMWTSLDGRTPLVWGRSFVTALLRAATAAPPMERGLRNFATEPPRLTTDRQTTDRLLPAPLAMRERFGAGRETLN